jgi:tetratricopeptide (TPR) repeat protein
MISKLEKLLKEGNLKEVQSHLEKVEASKVERSDALGLAGIARRAGYHRLAFKILNPIVRPKNKLEKIKATSEELAEYGMILYRLGVISESRKVLNSLEAKKSPEHFLYLAFSYFSEWDYQKAKSLLESYVNFPGLNSYSKLLGKINLAQAYLGLEEPKKAIPIALEAIAEAKLLNLNLILANALQNLVDAYVDCKDFDKMNGPLKELKELTGDHYRYNLYVKRSIAVTKLPDVKLIRELGKAARQKRLPELARECDFIEAVATKNAELFKKVYFGSPYPEYRKRILRHWGGPIDLGDSYLWTLNPEKKLIGVFDTVEGCEVGTKKQIKKGSSIHRLIRIFATNMYKTYKSETIHSLLFPNELLDLSSSIHRVYDTIARARSWLAAEGVGFSIAETHGEYSLVCNEGYQIKIPLEPIASQDLAEEKMRELKTLVGDRFFTVNDVKTILQASTSTANRILRELISRGEVEKIGKSNATKYRFFAGRLKKTS